MRLTKMQQQLVEENIGLVGSVIKSCVNNPNEAGIYTYSDLFQIGCIGLCKASLTYTADGRAKFSTYAYILIRNEIYKQLEYAKLRSERELYAQPNTMSKVDNSLSEYLAFTNLIGVLDAAASSTSGVLSKGIDAIRMQAQGLSCKEIGDRFSGAKANHVTAWMSKARKHLKSLPEIADLRP